MISRFCNCQLRTLGPLTRCGKSVSTALVRQGAADAYSQSIPWVVGPDMTLVRSEEAASRAASASPASGVVDPPTLLSLTLALPARVSRDLLAYVLPHGYPSSVAPSYRTYAGWMFAGTLFSSISGVLSTQSLLYAIGLGAGAVPMAAAINWVLKDGLGQLGGVAAAALINNRFDSDPKRWRFLSGVAQDAATLLEILTPLAPAGFLPLAALANVGKNVAWLSASATRAGIHLSLAARGNLADVTAKSGSQATAASTAGTFLGIALSPVVGVDPYSIMIAFGICSAAHLSCLHQALRGVVLLSCSPQRLALATAPVFQDLLPAAVARSCPPSEDDSKMSSLTPLTKGLDIGADRLLQHELGVPHRVLSPLQVSKLDVFAPWDMFESLQLECSTFDVRDSAAAMVVSSHSTLAAHRMVVVGPSVGGWCATRFSAFLRASDTEHSKYVVVIMRACDNSSLQPGFDAGSVNVGLLLLHDASWRDGILGYLHALFAARHLRSAACKGTNANVAVWGHLSWRSEPLISSLSGSPADLELVRCGRSFVCSVGDGAVAGLEKAGWWVGQPLLEHNFDRRLWLSPPAAILK